MRIMPKCEQDVGRNEWGRVAGCGADVGREQAESGQPKRDKKIINRPKGRWIWASSGTTAVGLSKMAGV